MRRSPSLAIRSSWGLSCDEDNGDDSGSAYIFRRNGDTWDQEDKFLAGDGAEDDYFGASVAISGDTVIVGARYDDDNGYSSGSAYIFRRKGENWVQQTKLLASDGAVDGYFGSSVAVSGNTAIVGACEPEYMFGSAYVFRQQGEDWVQQTKLVDPVGVSWIGFGYSVAISDDMAIVGAPTWHDPGSAYVFSTGTVPANSLAISPDGEHLYKVSGEPGYGEISVFDRDDSTGMLTLADKISDPVNLPSADVIEFSPTTGDFAYVATDLGVAVYSRNADSGALTFVQTLDTAEAGRPTAIEAVPKPDSQDWFVHVAGEGGYVITFDCSPTSHETSGTPTAVAMPSVLVVSPDGGNLYVGSRAIGAISVFSRDPSTGALTFLERIRNGLKRTRGLDDVASLVVGQDHVFAVSTKRDSLVAFLRDEEGKLTCIQRLGNRGVQGLENPNSLVLSPDGLSLYAGSSGAGAVRGAESPYSSISPLSPRPPSLT